MKTSRTPAWHAGITIEFGKSCREQLTGPAHRAAVMCILIGNGRTLIPLTTIGLARNYREAAALRKIHMSQNHFSARYQEESSWALGPFTRDESLTFTTSQPVNIKR